MEKRHPNACAKWKLLTFRRKRIHWDPEVLRWVKIRVSTEEHSEAALTQMT